MHSSLDSVFYNIAVGVELPQDISRALSTLSGAFGIQTSQSNERSVKAERGALFARVLKLWWEWTLTQRHLVGSVRELSFLRRKAAEFGNLPDHPWRKEWEEKGWIKIWDETLLWSTSTYGLSLMRFFRTATRSMDAFTPEDRNCILDLKRYWKKHHHHEVPFLRNVILATEDSLLLTMSTLHELHRSGQITTTSEMSTVLSSLNSLIMQLAVKHNLIGGEILRAIPEYQATGSSFLEIGADGQVSLSSGFIVALSDYYRRNARRALLFLGSEEVRLRYWQLNQDAQHVHNASVRTGVPLPDEAKNLLLEVSALNEKWYRAATMVELAIDGLEQTGCPFARKRGSRKTSGLRQFIQAVQEHILQQI